jgi:hypothetical protein
VKVSERVRGGDLVYKITDWIIHAQGGWPIRPDLYNELKESYHQDPWPTLFDK